MEREVEFNTYLFTVKLEINKFASKKSIEDILRRCERDMNHHFKGTSTAEIKPEIKVGSNLISSRKR